MASLEAVKTPILHSTLEDLLESVNLQQYSELFKQEMIDLNMLVNLKPEQFMEMVKDIGIVPWGHRHRLRTALEDMKTNNGNDTNKEADCSKEKVVRADDSEYNEYAYNDILAKECALCIEGSQHMCRICGKSVCVLFCSIQDPESDNEIHRIHKA